MDQPKVANGEPGATVAWWNDERLRGIFWQIVVVGGVVLLGWYLVQNTLDNLAARNIATGFGFLRTEAAFSISESPIAYSPTDNYLRALGVGLLNTLAVSAVGIVWATLLGTLIGIARLSHNWLVAKLASIYVELVRNVPLLLQLFVWYVVITESLPGARNAYHPIDGVFLSNRGLRFPIPVWETAHVLMAVALAAAVAGAIILARWAKARQDRTGQPFPVVAASAGLLIGLPLLAYLAGGAPTALNMPELKGFNFEGGHAISPEFTALVAGLVVYTAAFIAEVVRSGIVAVPRGQTEAAMALGLHRGQTLRLVTLPQAMRVIIPPMTSQYLNLTKNSSLAVAIGYPDLVSIANTAISQTGQAIEGVAIIMATYLTVSLAISGFMNWYNKRVALVTR